MCRRDRAVKSFKTLFQYFLSCTNIPEEKRYSLLTCGSDNCA
ncbi:hypothetical protein BN132_2304 [Cronobacter turicensis 564]|nr:hypothetical protein BN132_2304 [Cronobacter turicensis 564]